MKDYCDWLLDANARITTIERDWSDHPEIHDSNYATLQEALDRTRARSVVEIGCGTGLLAKRIPSRYPYIGFDKSAALLSYATLRNPFKQFLQGDIRKVPSSIQRDMVICFGTMKHFAHHEWDGILSRVLSCGLQYATIELPNPERHPDKTYRKSLFVEENFEFPHVWVSEQWLVDSAKNNGFSLLYRDDRNVIEPTYILQRT